MLLCGQTANQTPNESANQNNQPNTQEMNRSSRWNSEHPMQSARARASDQVNRMLTETQRARRALRNGNTQLAKTEVSRALATANELSSSRTGTNDIIPLYSEIGEYTFIGPRQRGANTQSATSGSADRTTSPQSNGAHNVAVRRVVGEYTSAGLDVHLAQAHLEAAQKALNAGNTRHAEEALRGVEDSVLVSSVAADMPLLRARENLMLARAAVNQGHYREAHSALNAACRALNTYDQSGGSHASQAQQLRSEISSYNQSLEQQHAGASAKIESWWNQMSDWNTPLSANQSARNNPPNQQ
jgi:hypothetical protein